MSLLSRIEPEDYTQKSDEELLALSVRHPALFQILIQRYEAAFRRKVVSILGDKDEVEDVLQESFTRIYLNAAKFTPQEGATFASWGYRILTNVSFTYYQKLKRRGATQLNLDTELFEMLPEVAHDQQADKIREEYVVSILVRMPASLGRMLKMHFLDDRSQGEIATEMGLTVSAVKARIHRAKKLFKKIDMDLSHTTLQTA